MRPQVLCSETPKPKALDKYAPCNLRYSAVCRCRCGAGMAYPVDNNIQGSWRCSAILLGVAVPGLHDELPFAYYSLKPESNYRANYATTRPTEQGRIVQKTLATCSCGHTWEKGPYLPQQRQADGAPGVCAECGNTNGSNWLSRTEPGKPLPIQTRVIDCLETPSGEIIKLEV